LITHSFDIILFCYVASYVIHFVFEEIIII